MKFSVVVPCHNASATVAQTLASIAAQTWAPHEIIVVDDNSTDDSRAQIENCGVPVRFYRVDFACAGAARNVGIAAATGDWIALCDADDVWFSHHLAQAAQVLGDGDDVSYMANHCLRRADKDEPLPDSMTHRIEASGGGKMGAAWLDILVDGFHFGHSTVIYRRDALREIGGFDESFARQEDLDLWLRMIARGTWAYGAQAAMAYRTDTPGSLSKNIVKSEIFYLRALLRNRANFPGAALQILLNRNTRHALSLAFVDGTRADFRAAYALARPHISPQLRLFYALAPLFRPLVRGAIRLKRRWVWRHDPARGVLNFEESV